jgi:hypothetical protein
MRLFAAILLLASSLPAADLSGIWVGQIPARNGEMQDVAFKLTQTGATLGGKIYGDYQSFAISEGKVTGDEVTFVIVTQEQAGNQINDTRVRYTGVLKDGQLEVTRERETSTNAGNGGTVQFRGNTKTTFKLKKLI